MFKRFILIGLCLLIIAGNAFAVRQNASPVIVNLTKDIPSVEVEFAYPTRDLYIYNHDSSNGIWVNFRGGDTDGLSLDIAGNGSRYYIPPSDGRELYDFQTRSITIISDIVISGDATASPVTVLSVF